MKRKCTNILIIVGAVGACLLLFVLSFCLLYRGDLFLGRLTSQLAYEDDGLINRWTITEVEQNTPILSNTIDGEEVCFSYSQFPYEIGMAVNDYPFCYTYCWQNDKYIVVSYKYSDFQHFHLRKHRQDHLLYLNTETGVAELVYQSGPHTRILYGNTEWVVVYNADDNVYQYIDCVTGDILLQKTATLKTTKQQYTFSVDETEGFLSIYETYNPETTLEKLRIIDYTDR